MRTWDYSEGLMGNAYTSVAEVPAPTSNDPYWGYGERVTLDTYLAGGLYIIALTFSFIAGMNWIPHAYAIVWGIAFVYLALIRPQHKLRIMLPLIRKTWVWRPASS